MLTFHGAVVLHIMEVACAQCLQAGHDPYAQPHGPERRKGNTGEKRWKEDPAGKMNMLRCSANKGGLCGLGPRFSHCLSCLFLPCFLVHTPATLTGQTA